MYYLNPEHILLIHKAICETFKNRLGILNQWQLESLCAHLQNDEYYPTIYEKLSHLFFGLVQFHIFVDANKRTALMSALVFISSNSSEFWEYDVEKSALFLEQLALSVATKKISESELPNIVSQFFSD